MGLIKGWWWSAEEKTGLIAIGLPDRRTGVRPADRGVGRPRRPGSPPTCAGSDLVVLGSDRGAPHGASADGIEGVGAGRNAPVASDLTKAVTRVAEGRGGDLIVVGSRVTDGTRHLSEIPKAVMDRARPAPFWSWRGSSEESR